MIFQVEMWRKLGDVAVIFLTQLFNRILDGKRILEEWSFWCPSSRTREMCKVAQTITEYICRSTSDAMFALQMLIEKYREGQKELHSVFVDLEKMYDRVPRDELWYGMRNGVNKKYVSVVHDMSENSLTAVRCMVGTMEWFSVEVGLHQGSAGSPFLFTMIMDRMSDGIRQESLWSVLFADDIVICGDTREKVEVERWQYAPESRVWKLGMVMVVQAYDEKRRGTFWEDVRCGTTGKKERKA
ncbi:uncharacterized protein LOC122249672 [Penaeus japonicus]|uniref:uncharacterized protein LOC122249100 n=1 Tax=Penaeus japonicus TaxID=27405 RepID=UPI001C7101A6|nr:uncharacterized protein LOC122249100 [Penaeus japonicus]XP_042866669.1 uncharacterized protein LOC122249672 [Penaeus japonicus]